VKAGNYMAHELRLSRADPPGLAADDDARRTIYGSALQQFEELLAAAQAVGPASQPLLLFYALSQGGRAIVAAHGESVDLFGHRLTEVRDDQAVSVLHRRIKRSARDNPPDTFGAVMRATHAPDFNGEVELGAVWAAIPRVHRLPDDAWRPDWRLTLDVRTRVFTPQQPEGMSFEGWSFSGNPLVDRLAAFADGRYPTLPTNATAGLSGGEGKWIARINVPDVDSEAAFDLVAPKIYGGYGGESAR
jgi:hypothetical protein